MKTNYKKELKNVTAACYGKDALGSGTLHHAQPLQKNHTQASGDNRNLKRIVEPFSMW